MILKKSLLVMRYGVEKFRNCSSIFSETVKDKSHEIFNDDRSLDWDVQLKVEHVNRHFRSSPEVEKEIKIFKDNLSNQNLYQIIRSVFKFSKQLTCTRSWSVNFRFFQKEVSNFQFSILTSTLLLRCFTWNWYILLTLEMSRVFCYTFKKPIPVTRYEIEKFKNCFSIF